MNLEYCFECDQPTGHAGKFDDSLIIWGNPYCNQCYHDVMIELPGEVVALRAKIAALELFVATFDEALEVTTDWQGAGTRKYKLNGYGLEALIEARAAIDKARGD